MNKLYILCALLFAPSFIKPQNYTAITSKPDMVVNGGNGTGNYSSKAWKIRSLNGQNFSDYNEELQRQNDLASAKNLLQQLREKQSNFFDQRRGQFKNALNKAESVRRTNFEKNQMSKF
jgi:hypothetical protein